MAMIREVLAVTGLKCHLVDLNLKGCNVVGVRFHDAVTVFKKEHGAVI